MATAKKSRNWIFGLALILAAVNYAGACGQTTIPTANYIERIFEKRASGKLKALKYDLSFLSNKYTHQQNFFSFSAVQYQRFYDRQINTKAKCLAVQSAPTLIRLNLRRLRLQRLNLNHQGEEHHHPLL